MTDASSTEGDLPSIGNPARNALADLGVTTLGQVEAMTAGELLALHGIGPKAVRILEETLTEQGRSLRRE